MKSHPDATDAMVFFVRRELELELRMLTGMVPGVSPDLHKKPDDPFQTGANRSSTIAARHAAVEGTFVCDDALPDATHAALVASFDRLCAATGTPAPTTSSSISSTRVSTASSAA